MPSFDIISEISMNEIRNAVEQTAKEVSTRYDLKDSGSVIELTKDEAVEITAPHEIALNNILTLFKERTAKRGISLKSLDFGTQEKVGGDKIRQIVNLKKSLSEKERKYLVKLIKEITPKVQTQIQGEQVRVISKKRDELQMVISELKSKNLDYEVQFINFRD
jgi:cyclic-di-GMP-binding protein